VAKLGDYIKTNHT